MTKSSVTFVICIDKYVVRGPPSSLSSFFSLSASYFATLSRGECVASSLACLLPRHVIRKGCVLPPLSVATRLHPPRARGSPLVVLSRCRRRRRRQSSALGLTLSRPLSSAVAFHNARLPGRKGRTVRRARYGVVEKWTEPDRNHAPIADNARQPTVAPEGCLSVRHRRG